MKNILIMIICCIISPYCSGFTGDTISSKEKVINVSLKEQPFSTLKSLKLQRDYSNTPVFRGKIYSDFLGIEDDQPNGLLQTEAFFSFPLFRRELVIAKNKAAVSIFRNVLAPSFVISKLDDKSRYLDARYYDHPVDSTTRNLHTLDLIQYANWSNSIQLNLLTLKSPSPKDKDSPRWLFYVDAIGYHFRTGIKDTLRTNSQEFNLNSFASGFQMKLELRPELADKRFELDIDYSRFQLHLFNGSYRQMLGSQIINADLYPNEEFTYSDVYDVDKLQLRLTINSFKKVKKVEEIKTVKVDASGNKISEEIDRVEKEEKASSPVKAYIRFSYFGNFFEPSRETQNNFAQIQLGVELKLENLLSK